MRSGVLYQKGGSKSGSLDVSALVKKLKAIAWSLRNVGLVLILFALGGGGYIFGPLITTEVNYYLRPPQVAETSKLALAIKEYPTWEVPDSAYSLYIPKIDAKSRIIGGIDASNEKAYLEALKEGVAEASGLAHPGQKGTTYLFAHSTDSPLNYARYNAVFYLLDKIEPGDAVEIVYKGDLYKYQVAGSHILSAKDVTYLVPQTDEEQLVLQTCYPPGTTWKRLVVVAKPLVN